MFPLTEDLASNPPRDSFLASLLASASEGIDAPLLRELENHLDLLQSAGVDLYKAGTPGLLRGDRDKFFSGVAEVFAFGWFQRRGLLREIGVSLDLGESVSGKSCRVDGSMGLLRGRRILFDVKSLQAHVNQYLAAICEKVEQEVGSQGHQDLKMALHLTGAPDVALVRANLQAIIQAALNAIPEMLKGNEIPIWHRHSAAGFRLRGRLRKRRLQSSVFAVADEIHRRQVLFWSQCHQVSQTRPFVLVQVRVSGMGLEVGDMSQLLDWALKGYEPDSGIQPVFGSTSTGIVPKTGRTKADVQRHLSAVLLIDEPSIAEKAISRLFVNKYAERPLPRTLQHALR